MASINLVIGCNRWRWWYVALAVVTIGLIAGCGGPDRQVVPPPPNGPAGTNMPPPGVNCTKKASDEDSLRQALSESVAGDTICVSGDLGDSRLEIDKGG